MVLTFGIKYGKTAELFTLIACFNPSSASSRQFSSPLRLLSKGGSTLSKILGPIDECSASNAKAAACLTSTLVSHNAFSTIETNESKWALICKVIKAQNIKFTRMIYISWTMIGTFIIPNMGGRKLFHCTNTILFTVKIHSDKLYIIILPITGTYTYDTVYPEIFADFTVCRATVKI